MLNNLTTKQLAEIKKAFCEWSGDDPKTISQSIPGGVNGNTQAVRITCTDGDYIVAHDFDRETHDFYIEVCKFYSNEYIAKMQSEYNA